MADEGEGSRPDRPPRNTFTPEYARGYQAGYRVGYVEGVKAALEQLEDLSSQEPPLPEDIPNLQGEDDLHILGLSNRALGVLQRGGIMTITQLRQRGRAVWGLYGMGPLLRDEIIEKCAEHGISLRKF